MTSTLELGVRPVSLEDLRAVSRDGLKLSLCGDARAAMRVSEDWVASFSARMDSGEPTEAVYSINTGFGSLSGRKAFTSSAQARTYLAQNPAGTRAEQAFRTIVNGDLAVQNPELDPAQIAGGWALKVMPGATATPEQVEAVINSTTAGIGAKKGWF